MSCALSKVGAFGTAGMDFYVFLLGADELLPCLAQLTAPPNNHMQNDTFHGFVVSCFPPACPVSCEANDNAKWSAGFRPHIRGPRTLTSRGHALGAFGVCHSSCRARLMPYLLTVVSEDGNVRNRQFWVIEPLRYNMDYTPNLLVHLSVRSVPAESSEYCCRVHSRKSVIQQTILATERPVRRTIFLLTSAHCFSSSPT